MYLFCVFEEEKHLESISLLFSGYIVLKTFQSFDNAVGNCSNLVKSKYLGKNFSYFMG